MNFRDFRRHLEDYFSFMLHEFVELIFTPPIIWFWLIPLGLAYWLGQVFR